MISKARFIVQDLSGNRRVFRNEIFFKPVTIKLYCWWWSRLLLPLPNKEWSWAFGHSTDLPVAWHKFVMSTCAQFWFYACANSRCFLCQPTCKPLYKNPSVNHLTNHSVRVKHEWFDSELVLPQPTCKPLWY